MPDVITEAPLLRIRVTGQPAGTVLRCAGEMDLSNVDCLRRALSTAIEQGHPEVEVDLREVEFLDSSTIEALLTAHYELAHQGRTLRIRARPWAAHILLARRSAGLTGLPSAAPRVAPSKGPKHG